jgi:hypothetical protein
MSMPQIKAAGFNSFIATLRGMVPGPTFDEFVAGLPRASGALILEPPLALSWIPLEHAAPLYPLAFERLFDRDPVKMFELGRMQLRADMTGIYRMFLRIASPAFIAARTSDIYKLYARDCGTLRTVVDQPGRLEVLLEGRPFPSMPFYYFFRGTVFGTMELTGVRQLSVIIVEGGGNASRCQFRVTWG